jgi:hypothetical protein
MTTETASSVLVGLPLAIVICILVVCTLLLPVFVAQIASRMGKLLNETKQQAQGIAAMTQQMDRTAKAMERSSTDTADQLEINNALMRQLLRAYGHEPDA